MQRANQKPEVTFMTPAKAQKFLDHYAHYKGQRILRPKLLNHYANKMRNDNFFATTVMVARKNYDSGDQILLNGHHTLESIIQSGKGQWVTMEYWEVNSVAEEAELYNQFDGTGQRTLRDYIKSTSSSFGYSFPLDVSNAIVTAAIFKEGKERLYPVDKAKVLPAYREAAEFFNEILYTSVDPGVNKVKATSHLRRKPVYYAMLVTWEKCHRDAKIFWIEVRDGVNLKKLTPTHHLRDFLLTHNYSFGRGAQKSQSVSAHEMASRAITAWNRFRKGKKTKILKYYPAKAIPKAV